MAIHPCFTFIAILVTGGTLVALSATPAPAASLVVQPEIAAKFAKNSPSGVNASIAPIFSNYEPPDTGGPSTSGGSGTR